MSGVSRDVLAWRVILHEVAYQVQGLTGERKHAIVAADADKQ